MSASRKKQTLLEWASSELVALLGLDDESVRVQVVPFLFSGTDEAAVRADLQVGSCWMLQFRSY